MPFSRAELDKNSNVADLFRTAIFNVCGAAGGRLVKRSRFDSRCKTNDHVRTHDFVRVVYEFANHNIMTLALLGTFVLPTVIC